MLDDMRRNPAGDWSIKDVEAVCRASGIRARRRRVADRITKFHIRPSAKS
jgi:hypothetical protein